MRALAEASRSDAILLVVPAQAMRSVVKSLAQTMAAGSPLIAVELTEIFLDDVVRRIRTFAEAAANRDQAQCTFNAHAIKGACGNFGATGMARLAEEAERCCKVGAFDQIGALSLRISEELALVRAILDEHGLVASPGVPAHPRLGKPRS